MPSFAIGIPTLNRWDLLQPHMDHYLKDFPDTLFVILDNGKQGIDSIYHLDIRVKVFAPEKNMGVAASWNVLCDFILTHHSHALILNDDIYLGTKKEAIEKLLTDDFRVSTRQWCSFLMPKAKWEKVGKFDEAFFPAYFEDNDYAYRMKLQNIPIVHEKNLDPVIFKRSASLEKDPSVAKRFDINMKRYQDKWGGNPNSETFTVPFNYYELTDDILLQLGFRPSPVALNQFIVEFAGIKHFLAIEKCSFPKDDFGYRFMIRPAIPSLNINEHWYRYLKSKQDVLDLIFGLTGIKHSTGV